MVVHGGALLPKLLPGHADVGVPVRRYCRHLLEEALPADGEGQLGSGQVFHAVQDVCNDAYGKLLVFNRQWLVDPLAVVLPEQRTAGRHVSFSSILTHRY